MNSAAQLLRLTSQWSIVSVRHLKSFMPEHVDSLVRDRLARQRTKLANERTLLSYIRTALGFFAIGIPALWWLEGVGFQSLGVVSLIMGLLFLGIGVWRFVTIKEGIDRESD